MIEDICSVEDESDSEKRREVKKVSLAWITINVAFNFCKSD